MQVDTTSKTNVLCDFCRGYGYNLKTTLYDYHRGEYKVTKHICASCEGSGILVKTSILKFTPFKGEEAEYNTLDLVS